MAELSDAEKELLDANIVQAAAALKVAALRYAAACLNSEIASLDTTQPDIIAPPEAHPATSSATPDSDDRSLVYVVNHETAVRLALCDMLETNGLLAQGFADGVTFLDAFRRRDNVCLLADTALSDLGGIDLLLQLRADADLTPVIIISDTSDVGMAVNAMKAGAIDFIEKPIDAERLVDSIRFALAGASTRSAKMPDRSEALHQFASLTTRQRQILELVLSGQPNKNIAADLGISQRTVESHRAAIMQKSGSKSLPALARLALSAGDQRAN